MCDCENFNPAPDTVDIEADPCPFCGKTDVSVCHDARLVKYMVCHSCRAEGPVGGTVETAVFLWNTRREP